MKSSTPRRKRRAKKKGVPLPLKRVRKSIPPPVRVFKNKRRYGRRKRKSDLERELVEEYSGSEG